MCFDKIITCAKIVFLIHLPKKGHIMISRIFILPLFTCFIFQFSTAMNPQPSDNNSLYQVMSNLYERSAQSQRNFIEGYKSHLQPKQNNSAPIKTNIDSAKQLKQSK